MSAKSASIEELSRILAATYPDAHCELNFRNPWELLVATILSAQCTDVQVNLVTRDLFSKYPTPAAVASAAPEEFEEAIRRIGLYRNKARNIQACSRLLLEHHGGEVPQSLEELVALPGVGRKTANVVLGNAFHKNCGVVVDTHVARLSFRLGLTRESDPIKIEQRLIKIVPQPHWTLFSHWLIFHGRRRCLARRPDCPNCELKGGCARRGLEARG